MKYPADQEGSPDLRLDMNHSGYCKEHWIESKNKISYYKKFNYKLKI